MTANELDSELEKLKKDKNREQVAKELGVSRTTLHHWSKGNRDIPEDSLKLLRLYFYGEIPFGVVEEPLDLSSALSFTPQEWAIMEILAKRKGLTGAKQWVIVTLKTEYQRELAAKAQEEKELPKQLNG